MRIKPFIKSGVRDALHGQAARGLCDRQPSTPPPTLSTGDDEPIASPGIVRCVPENTFSIIDPTRIGYFPVESDGKGRSKRYCDRYVPELKFVEVSHNKR